MVWRISLWIAGLTGVADGAWDGCCGLSRQPLPPAQLHQIMVAVPLTFVVIGTAGVVIDSVEKAMATIYAAGYRARADEENTDRVATLRR